MGLVLDSLAYIWMRVGVALNPTTRWLEAALLCVALERDFSDNVPFG